MALSLDIPKRIELKASMQIEDEATYDTVATAALCLFDARHMHNWLESRLSSSGVPVPDKMTMALYINTAVR